MPQPKVLLLSRSEINEKLPQLQQYLSITPVAMAIVHNDADKDAAVQVAPTVAMFENLTAIVADFVTSMVVNDDGSCELINLPPAPPQDEEPLIKVVSA